MSVAPIIPAGCPWVYDLLVGQEWPAGDEDSMRRGAHAWLDAKKSIEQVAGHGDDASAGVTDNVQAVSVDAFTTFWDEYIAGDKSVLGELLQQCDGLASALNGQANEVEYAKLSIDITIVLIAIQILIAIAESVCSLGGSLLEIPFITVFGQRAVAMLLARFLQMALMMILPDVITQVAMQIDGDQKGWDWSKTIPALESAGIAGVLGMAGGAAVAKLPFMSADAAGTLGGKALQGLVHFGEGGTVNVMTGLSVDMINGKPIDPGMLLTQFVSGGFMATAFYLPHVFGPEGTPLTFAGPDGSNYHILLDSNAMDQFDANGHRVPDGFSAPVYNEKGLRVGTATFNDAEFNDAAAPAVPGSQTVRISTLLSHGEPTNLTGYSVAGHDGSVQTYGFDHGQVSLRTYAAPSDGNVTIATIADGARVDQTVPAGSIVRYTADGTPYRADIADGTTVAIWQTSTPGSPLERSGTIVYPDLGPVAKSMGLDEAAFYAQDGAQVGSISLLTGWLHVTDRASYDAAILDQYHAAADVHPRSAIAEALNGQDGHGDGSAAVAHPSPDQPIATGHEAPVTFSVVEGSGDHRIYDVGFANGDEVRVHVDRVKTGWVVADGSANGARIRAAAQALADDGNVNIVGHGDQYGLLFGRNHVSFDHLASLIDRVPDDVAAVRLLVCGAANGDGPALLARLFDRPVLATKGIVWFDKNGGVRSALADDTFGQPPRPGEPVNWELYHPNGTSSTIEPDDPLWPSQVGRSGQPPSVDVGDWEKAGFTPGEQPRTPPSKDVTDALESGPPDPAKTGVASFRKGQPQVSVGGQAPAPLLPADHGTFPDMNPELNVAMSRAAFKVLLEGLHLDPQADAALITYISDRQQAGHDLGEILREPSVMRDLAKISDIARIIQDRADRSTYNSDHPRPVQDILDEALTMFINPELSPRFKGTDFAEIAQVRIADVYGGRPPRPSQMQASFPQYDPQANIGTHVSRANYDTIASDLLTYRGLAERAGVTGFDSKYAEALLQLADPNTRQTGVRALEALAHEIDPGYVDLSRARSYDRWMGGMGAAFVRQAVSLFSLTFEVESARHPEALFSNLMAFDLVRRGKLTLEDAFFYDIMRPSMATSMAARVDWLRGYLRDFPQIAGGRGGETRASILADIIEFQRREREIWGRYVQETLGINLADFFDANRAINGMSLDARLEDLLRDMLYGAGIGRS